MLIKNVVPTDFLASDCFFGFFTRQQKIFPLEEEEEEEEEEVFITKR